MSDTRRLFEGSRVDVFLTPKGQKQDAHKKKVVSAT